MVHSRRGLFSFALVLAGCGAAPPDVADSERSCAFSVSFRPGMAPEIAKSVRIPSPPRLRGDWDGWAMPTSGADQAWSTSVAPDGTVWRTLQSVLPPGTWHYFIDVGGTRVLDEVNPRTAFARDPDASNDQPFALEVSEVVVPDCTQPLLEVLESHGGTDGVSVRARFERGAGGAALDGRTLQAELWSGAVQLAAPTVEREGPAGVHVHASGLAPGKYTVRLTAADVNGRAAEPVASSAFVETSPDRTLGDGLIYQIMIDRFRGSNGALAPPPTPGLRAGGTLDGVRAALEAGYFERLGVSTLWLSPVYRNPEGTFMGRDGHAYEAYHGYWPIAPRAVDDRLGGEAALDALVQAAHARSVRVILDVVPNHVHAQHPYYQAHSLQSPSVAQAADPRLVDWFNDGPGWCVCANGCWATSPETCWFDTYLPDLDWHHPDVLATGSDDLAWWMTRFDLDGLRLDAVPMMPRAATRRIVEAVRATAFRGGLDRLLLGEIFTGAGEGGRAQIRMYLGDKLDGLDSAFDFPLMWSLRAAAGGRGSFQDVEAQLAQASTDFAGSGSTLARMLDNHDITRFLSEAVDPGVGATDPWVAPPAQPTDAAPYLRARIALAYLLTAPGMPVLYYGDEVGLAGAGDPDSRRVLPDVLVPGSLAAPQQALLDAVARLGRLRRCLPALRSTQRTVAFADAEHLVAVQGGGAIVALSVASAPNGVNVAGAADGNYVDVLSGARVTVAHGTTDLTLAPLAAAVYIPEDSSCVE